MAPMAVNFKTITHYYRIWKQSVLMNFRVNTASKIEFVCYVIAKVVRLGFFFVFIYALFRNTATVAGYARGEVLLFCAFMNTIDIAFQLFCRGLTTVPNMVRKGEYDILFTKPVSPFFLTCFKMFDFMDLATVGAALVFLVIALLELPYTLLPSNMLLAIVAWGCSLLMAIALNVMIAALAFWVTEIENGVWIYRDLVYVGRFPPEVYPEHIRQFFTFIIPILLIVAMPTQVLIGRARPTYFFVMGGMTLVLLLVSRFVWQRALQRYTSASA